MESDSNTHTGFRSFRIEVYAHDGYINWGVTIYEHPSKRSEQSLLWQKTTKLFTTCNAFEDQRTLHAETIEEAEYHLIKFIIDNIRK